MFTVDINDGQWLQYMCTQMLNAFTINKVGMHADVVANGGGASCDVDGRICSTLSRYCGGVILECGMMARPEPVCGYARRGRINAEFIS